MSAPIKRQNIRKGDRVRMVVTSEFTAACDLTASDIDEGDTETYELIERPVVLPTERGFYADKDGDVWNWLPQAPADYLCEEYAPYTLLRPVAEVAAEVLAEVQLEMSSSADYWQADLAKIRARYATN